MGEGGGKPSGGRAKAEGNLHLCRTSRRENCRGGEGPWGKRLQPVLGVDKKRHQPGITRLETPKRLKRIHGGTATTPFGCPTKGPDGSKRTGSNRTETAKRRNHGSVS